MAKPKEKTIWECHKCGQRITLAIPLTHPPVCSRHTGGGTQMKKVSP